MPKPCRSVAVSVLLLVAARRDRQESATSPPAREGTIPLSHPFPVVRAGATLAVVTLLALAGCSEAPTEWRAANPTLDGTELRVEPGAILLETPLEGSELRAVVERHLGDGPGEAGEIGPHWDPRYTSVHLSDATPSSVLGLIESLRRDRGIIFASPCYSFHQGLDSGWGGYFELGYYQPLNGLDILFREGTSRLASETVLDWIGGEVYQRPDPPRRLFRTTFPPGTDPLAVGPRVDQMEIVERAEVSALRVPSVLLLSSHTPAPVPVTLPHGHPAGGGDTILLRLPAGASEVAMAHDPPGPICG